MHTNPGLTATITDFLLPTTVGTRNWTPTAPSAQTRQRQGIGLYNDEVGESDEEWEEDGD
ncbi:hypothetical protein Q9L58_010918 [Maublancomyces gigas]|uniref:Uncharacterized protein n=1 Tax=Discina gigas TaxID=1032678 RepID=A0ABR3G358_9PEZI